MSNEQNRIYQLTNEQLNIISSDLIEAIVLLSGKKDKSGLLTELNELNNNLEIHLGKETTIVDDLYKLYEKVTKDEKIDLKIKQLEINQFEIKDMKEMLDRVEGFFATTKTTHDTINKGIVVNVGKIAEDIKTFQKSQTDLNEKLEKKEKDLEEQSKKTNKNIAVEKKLNFKILGAGIFLGGFGLGLTSILILIFSKLDFQDALFLLKKVFY